MKLKSLVVTEFNDEMGIPSNVGCSIFAKTLFNHRDKFKTITLACSNDDSLHLYMSYIQFFKEDLTTASFVNNSIKESIYY